MRRRHLLSTVLIILSSALGCGCDRDAAVDAVVDTTTDRRVWLEDARKISAALPQRIADFTPSDGADPFTTTFETGPVFGSSCTYQHDGRQLVVRVESGNIRARAAAALDAGGGARVQTVHGQPAVVRWGDVSRVGQVTFVVARRFLVEVRLVPADGDAEVVRLAEAIDTRPFESL
ncbi:MAG TPA: hypothetical protein VIY73_22485, partial [Polyangiaceae bacterium]